MRDDSDILGNPLRPDPALVSSSSSSSSSSGSSFFFYVFLLTGTVLVFRYYSQIQAFFQTDPELAHRRRLGIPDHDKRPLEAAKPRTRPPPVKQPVRLEQQLERERTLATPRRDQVHVQFASPPVIQRPPRQPEQPPAQKTQHFVEPRQPVGTTQSEPAPALRNEKRARDEEGPVDKRARARVEPTEVIKEEIPMEVDARVVQTRGTKRERDRAEEEGSVVGEGDENSTKEKKRQRRKSKRMSDMGPPPEVHPRGVKRGVEDDTSVIGDDSDVGESKKSKKKKKGRQSRSSTYDGDREDDYALYDRGRLPFPETDIDMEEPDIAVSTNPNKEWEVNGVRYRINSDGQRVRFSFVKKQTRRYPMPADAIHPDAKSVVKLCVERWLTDAEYAAHKQQGLLAWESSYEHDDMDDIVQGQSSRASGKQNQLSIATGTPTRGKTLLYGSPSAPSSPALSRRESITSVGSATSTPARRSRLSGMGTTPRNSMIRYAAEKLLEDSTNRTDDGKDAKEKRGDDARIVSKWEKQDLEAEGMKALRERKGTPKKVATPNLSTTMPSSGAPSLLLTKPTLATSTSAPAVSASNPLFPLGTPSAPSSAPTAAPTASPASTPSKPTLSGLGLGLPTSMAPPQAPPTGLNFSKPAATPVQPQPKPPVSLFPSASATAPAPAVSAPAPGSFTFPKLPASTAAAPPSTAPTPAANNGGNLFTRVGPPATQPQPLAQSKNEQPKTQFTSLFPPPPAPASAPQLQAKPPTQPSTLFPPAPPAAQNKDAQPLFSFQAAMAKPNTPAATFAPPAAPSTESDKAKWSFNHTIQAAPAASNPFGTNTTKASAPAPTTAAPANAFNPTNGSGEKQPLFSFKAALTPGQQQEEKKTSSANAGMAPKPLFSSGGGNLFGKPNEQKKDDAAPKNLFGTTGGGGFGTPAAVNQEKKDETPKPLFGFGTGSVSGTGGGFGQPKKDDTAASTKPLFGTFGASTTNTTDAPKPLFGSFTNLPTTSAGTKTTEPSASKPTFGGLGVAAPAAEAPKPTPSFTFTAAPAAEASKPTSSFNFASTPTAAPSAPSGSLFGGQAPTNKPEEKKKEGGSGFAGFGSTTTSNGFGGASGASTPAFGTGPSTTPFGTGPSTTPFGTGASTPSPFGGGGSTSPAFGTVSASGNGSAPSLNPAPAPTFGGFGSTSKPTFGSTPSSVPAFGAPAPSSTSTETKTLFGAPSAAPGASNATSNPFGTPSSANSSAFGSGGSAFSFGGNSTAGSSTSFSFGQK